MTETNHPQPMISENNVLQTIYNAIGVAVTRMNPARQADGGEHLAEPKPFLSMMILFDRIAGAIDEQLHGRTVIERDADGNPIVKIVQNREGVPIKAIVQTKKQGEGSKSWQGMKKYLDVAQQNWIDAYERDPGSAATDRTYRFYAEQEELYNGLLGLQKAAIENYILAAAGTQKKWQPWIERQIAQIAHEALHGKPERAPLEGSPEAEARKAEMEEKIAAIRARKRRTA